eukprot:s5605_g3.t1
MSVTFEANMVCHRQLWKCGTPLAFALTASFVAFKANSKLRGGFAKFQSPELAQQAVEDKYAVIVAGISSNSFGKSCRLHCPTFDTLAASKKKT